MNKRQIMSLIPISFLLLCMVSVYPGCAEQDPAAVKASAQVFVSSVTLDPEVLMPWDTGTVTIEVTNSGNEGVPISTARLRDSTIKTTSSQYDVVGSIGAGNAMKFIFTIQADGKEGIFNPVFSLDFRDAGYLRNPFQVRVQDRAPTVAILDKPDSFRIGKKEKLTLHVGNPRDNKVTGVTIVPAGQGHEVMPSSYFVGVLEPDTSVDVPFTFTPGSEENLVFSVLYQNGVNEHEESYAIPVVLGQSKTRAEPVLSNIILEDTGEYYRLSGDVTNSGLENANGVVITTDEPAVPTIPYRLYAVGALKPDDFAGFEVTFTTPPDATNVTVVISYKDDDGNDQVRTTEVNVKSLPESESVPKEDLSPMIFVVVIFVLALVGGVIYYTRFRR